MLWSNLLNCIALHSPFWLHVSCICWCFRTISSAVSQRNCCYLTVRTNFLLDFRGCLEYLCQTKELLWIWHKNHTEVWYDRERDEKEFGRTGRSANRLKVVETAEESSFELKKIKAIFHLFLNKRKWKLFLWDCLRPTKAFLCFDFYSRYSNWGDFLRKLTRASSYSFDSCQRNSGSCSFFCGVDISFIFLTTSKLLFISQLFNYWRATATLSSSLLVTITTCECRASFSLKVTIILRVSLWDR